MVGIREDLKKVTFVAGGEGISHIREAKAEIKKQEMRDLALTKRYVGTGG